MNYLRIVLLYTTIFIVNPISVYINKLNSSFALFVAYNSPFSILFKRFMQTIILNVTCVSFASFLYFLNVTCIFHKCNFYYSFFISYLSANEIFALSPQYFFFGQHFRNAIKKLLFLSCSFARPSLSLSPRAMSSSVCCRIHEPICNNDRIEYLVTRKSKRRNSESSRLIFMCDHHSLNMQSLRAPVKKVSQRAAKRASSNFVLLFLAGVLARATKNCVYMRNTFIDLLILTSSKILFSNSRI